MNGKLDSMELKSLKILVLFLGERRDEESFQDSRYMSALKEEDVTSAVRRR